VVFEGWKLFVMRLPKTYSCLGRPEADIAVSGEGTVDELSRLQQHGNGWERKVTQHVASIHTPSHIRPAPILPPKQLRTKLFLTNATTY
jgi:hypothetical protein